MKFPEPVELTKSQADALIQRIETNTLTQEDIALYAKIVRFCLWLQFALEEAKIGLGKLRQLFGIKSKAQKKS